MIRPSRHHVALAYLANGDLPPLSALQRLPDPAAGGDRGLRAFAWAMTVLSISFGTWAGMI
ncbi:hypothetical protein [Roseomonas sp. KE0001]|uniref:hypothetical protein n=1 Tax=Roseomonas sp. KE0001 TaxID=2479201 RepID=UPI0018DF8258|nr:hypothetical protein [Roseomonas sp. KE0001]MBI0432814.1 hypothetical protein [Roseomonas sp. KE0001]